MELGIRGRTAMVAAGSKGLGRAIAAALVNEGARVSIGARSAGRLAEAEQALCAAGGEVLAVPVDVGKPEDLERWHAATVEQFGPPALVVTSTGGPPVGQLEDLTEDAWRAGIDGTLMNVVRLCRLVLPAMRAARYGRIVHLTSFVMTKPTTVKLYRWDDMPKEKVTDRIDRRLVVGERMMLAHVYLAKGAIVPRHAHENEQLTYILEGALKFWIGEDGAQELVVRAGDVLVIPSNVPHKAEALEDTLDVDVFSPPRQDWLDGTDDYLRRG
jgi:NAD(P)-dependent dehydrogenase (short-subunit alcohol dehydrogenase family)